MRDREEDPRVFFFRSDDDRQMIAKQNSPLLLFSFLLCSLQYPSPASIKTADRRAKGGGGGERKYKRERRESPLVSPSSREGTNALLRDDSLSRLLTLLSRLCVSARDFPLLSKGTLPIYREQPREARGGEKEGRAKETRGTFEAWSIFRDKEQSERKSKRWRRSKKKRKKKTRPRPLDPLFSLLSVLPASIDRKRSP